MKLLAINLSYDDWPYDEITMRRVYLKINLVRMYLPQLIYQESNYNICNNKNRYVA